MQIENAADEVVQTEPPPVNRSISKIPRSGLLKPSDSQHRLGGQRFRLGDRIIYTADSGKVPIASKGTVVGLTQTTRETWLDIVFDMSFMSGTSLGDRCSPFRGSTVPTWSVLNLSDQQLVAMSKAAAARQSTVNHSSPLTVLGYGAPGINGQGQLTEARTPPPLRGSWRGAVAGQSSSTRASPGGNGHISRGRGYQNVTRGASATNLPFRQPVNSGQGVSPNGFAPRGRAGLGSSQGSVRGGYTPIDRGDNQTDVINNNPHFKPQAHHNVPPPTSLDNGPRGRGRGRGRGRSDRGRGIRGGGRGDGQRGQGNAVQQQST